MDPSLQQYLRRRGRRLGLQEAEWVRDRRTIPLRFVLHKHAARRLHYDLQLELDGVLRSWAIPRGPSTNPRERRMAIAVEDRSLELASFEGIVPEGEFGSGEAIVWDAGVYSPEGDGGFFFGPRDDAAERVRRALEAGRLSLFFWGYKLAGSWSLVKGEGSPREWIFVKVDDLFAEPHRNLLAECRSVLTRRTIDELRQDLARSLDRKRA